MSIAATPAPRADGRGRAALAAAVVFALIAIALIARALLAPEGSSSQAGIHGYLILQAAAVLALLTHRGRPLATWAAVGLAALLLANLAIFLAIDAGLFGPWLTLIALNLVAISVAGLLGLIGVAIAALFRPSDGPSRPPIVPGVVALLIATVLAGTSLAEDDPRRPVPPASTPPPVTLAPSPSPTPTLTPTPTPAGLPTFNLTITVVGNGSVVSRTPSLTCPGKTCTFPIAAGTIVTLTTRPGADSIFSSWTGCRNPCQLRMDQARQVTATFRLPTLKVAIQGKAAGTVQSEPGGIACPPSCEASFPVGTSVRLNASPAGSAAFTGWSGACGDFGTCELALKGNTSVSAQFETMAGPEYEAKSCSEARIQARRGQTAQVVACFVNSANPGTPITWTRGTATEVELAQCCPLGGPSPLRAWVVDPASETVYADVTESTVAPGQQANAVFVIRPPANATLGDHRLDGFLVLARTGAPVAGGEFSIIVTVVR